MTPTTSPQAEPRVQAIEISEVAPRPGRLHSLDVFRGITIAAMLLVNNPGTWEAVYPPLRHAVWHGVTPTDLIFPFFLFIVGVSMVFSFGKLLSEGVSRATLFGKTVKRAAILFGLGLVLQSYPWFGFDYGQLRIPGVLQRIALAFLVAAAIVLVTTPRTRAAAVGVLLLGYWAVMSWVPVPGIGAGVLQPGQDVGAWLDRALFGTNHLWAEARTWDPEGLLGTFPSAATVLLGVFAGEWLRSNRPQQTVVARLAIAGVVGLALGLLWNLAFPINKALWTSSFVLFTAGAGAFCLAACYWIVDVKGLRRWALPFTVFGVNAIAAYFLSSLMSYELLLTRFGRGVADPTARGWIYENAYLPWLSPLNASLAFALTFVLVWLGVMTIFYRRRIFIKV
jgi:predicted acyltransferase